MTHPARVEGFVISTGKTKQSKVLKRRNLKFNHLKTDTIQSLVRYSHPPNSRIQTKFQVSKQNFQAAKQGFQIPEMDRG